MALHARLIAASSEHPPGRPDEAEWISLPADLLFSGDRRMEAESYLAPGYRIRRALEAQARCTALGNLARIWQPSRLKGIQVGRNHGVPFLAATQVFDLRPVPRKYLAAERTADFEQRFVDDGTILVTCSGNVGRATLAYAAHRRVLISHDLLRVQPHSGDMRGWLYAFLRSQAAQEMMSATRYGHIIKHLEVGHLETLPTPCPPSCQLGEFATRVQTLLEYRNRAHDLCHHAEELFASRIEPLPPFPDREVGFSVPSSHVSLGRRRLEATFHDPLARAILRRFSDLGLQTQPLSKLTKRIWWMPRFRRVFGERGVPYMSAEELFSINASPTKRVMTEQAENASAYFVKAGWILMACSGQAYGLNGSVMLATSRHESFFFSHDLIRIVPDTNQIRAGYLVAALAHPQLGRPLVIRNAYGTSVPHLDPGDVADVPIVRLGPEAENSIGDLVEEAAYLRSQAEELENGLADDAQRVVDSLLSDFDNVGVPRPPLHTPAAPPGRPDVPAGAAEGGGA